MSAHVLWVVRSGTRLDALTYVAGDPVDPAAPWQRTHACELRPLSPGSHAELWAAWHAVAAVRQWDAATLRHVRVVLDQTAPGGDPPPDLPALAESVPPLRATAAHPRGFRGTKLQPPRRRRLPPIDLRPYLLGRNIHRVLARLGATAEATPHDPWFATHVLPLARGWSPADTWTLAALARAVPPELYPALVGVALAAGASSGGAAMGRGGSEAAMGRGASEGAMGRRASSGDASSDGASSDGASSDGASRASMGRGAPRASRGRGASDAAMGRGASEAAMGRGASTASPGRGGSSGVPARVLGWWSLVLAHAPERRLEAAQLVIASGVAASVPPPVELVVELPAETCWLVYRMLAGGAAVAYVRAGLALGVIVGRDVPPAGQHDVTALIAATFERIGAELVTQAQLDYWRPQLWQLCGRLPGFVALLGSPELAALVPPAAHAVLRFAGAARWWFEESPARRASFACDLAALVARAVQLPPAYQRAFVEHIAEVYQAMLDKSLPRLDACIALALRVARPPFSTRAALDAVLPALAHVREAACAAPDASWLALEHACRRDNDARVLGCGLDRLVRAEPALVATAFAHAPHALLAAADALAAVSRESAARRLAAYAASPIADPALADASIEALCAAVDPVARAAGCNPIRRVVRKHLAGTRLLTAGQLAGHRRRIAAALDVVRLAAIAQAVERSLAAQVGLTKLDSAAARHALAIMSSVALHRRQLRRLVTAALAGDVDWRLRHPRTAAWFAKHPRLDRAAWLHGQTTRAEVAGLGVVELAVEHDPLEALRLGTHVGSCLGRGGHLAYSAAAIVLDANKHVIYARDARGAVIGRQVVAISEADELVCFWVYGIAKRALEPVFRSFDIALAAHVGLPLLPTFGTYEIASILSHEWWDDLAWDVTSG